MRANGEMDEAAASGARGPKFDSSFVQILSSPLERKVVGRTEPDAMKFT